MSPAERMRALQVLHGPAKAHLHEPEKLKYLLAPVLTKSPADQQRFYDLFDRFYEESAQPLPVPERPSFWGKWGWLLVLVLLLMVAGLATLSAIKRINRPGIELIMPGGKYTLGDTLEISSRAEKVKSDKHQLRWELRDVESGEEERFLLDSARWIISVDTLSGSYEKEVRLQLLHREKEQVLLEETGRLTILCPNPPEVRELIFEPVASMGDTITFSALVEGEGPLEYRWDLDAGQESRDSLAMATYNQAGIYNIELRVSSDSEKGLCQAVLQSTIQVGTLASPPPYKSLQRDELSFTAAFTGWYWAILGLLAIIPILFLIRWLQKPREEEAEQGAPPAAAQSPDKPPYFIPFQSQNARIEVGQEQFLLANAMRIRQEGLRKEVDVPTSIRKTIDRGGFPNLEFRYSTQPTEYLILIDEHSPQSHQARLFQYFAEMLRDQDVLLNIFYYHTDLNRLWNAQFPKGISLEVLQRQYPHRRLVIMGDAHGLVDPHGRGKDLLRSYLVNTLKRWPHRLLITPLPPRSWSYEEDALHEYFVIFPADLRGLADAAAFLESGQIDEEIEEAPFLPWQQRHEQIRKDPEAEFRNWRQLEAHRDYLQDHPELYTWLRALAVYPSPTWELTIAIGEALKPLGVEVTLDNLLILARIPWLQQGRLHPRLRKEMLDELDEYPESLAREAVARELDAVSEEVAGSQVGAEWESNMAVQQFALSPFDEEVRNKVRDLWKKGLLSKKQVDELNKTMQRNTERVSRLKKGNFVPDSPDIRELLEEKEEQEETSRPLLRPAFWRFAASALLFLLLFLGSCNLNKSDLLHRLTFKQGEAEARWLVDQAVEVDSAVLLNNQAVGAFEQALRQYEKNKEQGIDPRTGAEQETSGTATTLPRAFGDALFLFERARQINPDYELAERNLARLQYNLATIWLGRIMELGGISSQQESTAMDRYDAYVAATNIPEAIDGYHGKGLIQFYQRDFRQADTLLGQIENRFGSTYFDTLSYRPHLRDLLDANVPAPDDGEDLVEGRELTGTLTTQRIDGSSLDRVSIEVTGQLVNAERPEIKLDGTVSLKQTGRGTIITARADNDGRFILPFVEVRTAAPVSLEARAVGFEVLEIPLGPRIDGSLPKQGLDLGVLKLTPKGPETPPIEQKPLDDQNDVEMEISVVDFTSRSLIPGVRVTVDQDRVVNGSEDGVFRAWVNPEEEFTIRLQKNGYVNRDMTFRDGQYESGTLQNIEISQNAPTSNSFTVELAREQPEVSVYFDVGDWKGMNNYQAIYEEYVSNKKRILRQIEKTVNPKVRYKEYIESAFAPVEEGFKELEDAAAYMQRLLDAGYEVHILLSGIYPLNQDIGALETKRVDAVISFLNGFNDNALFNHYQNGRLDYLKIYEEADFNFLDLDDYDPEYISHRRVDISFDISPPQASSRPRK